MAIAKRYRLTDDQATLLVTVGARTCALFTPTRPEPSCSGKDFRTWVPAVWESKRHFASRGLPWTTGGSAAERQAAGRALQPLAELELLRVHQHVGRRLGVSLLPAGWWWLWAVTELHTAAEVWPYLELVDTLTRLGRHNCGCVLEDDLIDDIEGEYHERIAMLELHSLPLAVWGLLDSHCDLQGHAGYRLTDAGREALAGTRPRRPRGLPGCDERLAALWDDVYGGWLRERCGWSGDGRHLVIPLGCGSWSTDDDDDDESDCVSVPVSQSKG